MLSAITAGSGIMGYTLTAAIGGMSHDNILIVSPWYSSYYLLYNLGRGCDDML